jgi:dTDP-4-amino-4,6-dideoxygalactose transaminase
LNGLRAACLGHDEISRFTASLKGYFRVRHCFLTSSGKAALTFILRAFHAESPNRDEVLIPAYTCYSVPSAIVRAGLKVRLCDIDPKTLDFDHGLDRHLEGGADTLLAVVCPHLFGQPADIQRVRNKAEGSGAAVIEDAAQAMGGLEKDRLLGTGGDAGFFSLGRGKALSAVEGGIIVTDSEKLGGRIEDMIERVPAHTMLHQLELFAYALTLCLVIWPRLFWLPKSMPGLRLGETIYDPGFPIRQFSAFQAGLARNWQQQLKSFQRKRKQNVSFWLKTLRRFSWLKPVPESTGPENPHPFIRFPALVSDLALRSALLDASEKRGLGIMPSYPDSIDSIESLGVVNPRQGFPGAKECARTLLTFPVHGYVTRRDRARIVKCLEEIESGEARYS